MEFLNDNPAVLAVAIFFARITDVSLGTVRTILVIRSRRGWAAFLGFFEVLIWLLAAGKVIQNLDHSWYLPIFYAGGFAAGNIVGIWLESRLALGSELVRAVSKNARVDLAVELRGRGYSVVEMPGVGDYEEPVQVLLVVEKRKKVAQLIDAICECDPEAFWTVSDIKSHPILPPLPKRMVDSAVKLK